MKTILGHKSKLRISSESSQYQAQEEHIVSAMHTQNNDEEANLESEVKLTDRSLVADRKVKKKKQNRRSLEL